MRRLRWIYNLGWKKQVILTKETYKTLSLHRTTKALLGKVLLDTKMERNELLFQLDEINDKLDFLIKATTIRL